MKRLRLQARTLARRIDALSLRERAILFASAVALLAAVADALVLSPQLAQQKALAQRMHRQNQELGTLRDRVARAAAPVSDDDSPRGRALRALHLVHEEQAALGREIEALAPAGSVSGSVSGGVAVGPDGTRSATAAPGLPALLERLLRRHDRLTLLHLATVGETAHAKGEAPAPAAGNAAAAPERALELKLQGQYPDLLQYLLDIERAVPGLRWSTWQLDARDAMPVLLLRLKLAGETR